MSVYRSIRRREFTGAVMYLLLAGNDKGPPLRTISRISNGFPAYYNPAVQTQQDSFYDSHYVLDH